jgi:hypothetical protein
MFLSVLFGCASITSLMFLLVPVGRISVDYPTNMSMALGCFNENSTLTLTDLDLHPCKFKLNEDSENNVINVSATIGECGSVCYHSEKSDTEATLETASSFVSDTNLDDSVGKEFLDAVFFPNDWDLEMSCLQNLNGRSNCQLGRKIGAVSRKEKNATLALQLFQNDYNIKTGVIPVLWMALEDESEFDQKSSDFQCSTYDEKLKLLQTVYSQENQTENYPTTHYRTCRSQCVVQINRSDLCSDKVREDVVNPQLTFCIYLLLGFVFQVFVVGSATLFDGAALVLVNEVRGDFGFQKMFGLIGISIFSPISGALMDYFNTNENDKNFR